MSVWSRLFGRETRALDPPSIQALMHSTALTHSGRYVNTVMAQNLSAVTACINAVATAMGSLPPLIYRVTAEGRLELRTHWVNRLFRRPNEWMTWPDLIEFVMWNALLHGNALLLIEADNAGRPVALVPIPWRHVQVEITEGGRLVYVVTRMTGPWGMAVAPQRYLSDQIFHLKDSSDDGFVGRSRISRAPEVIGNASSLQEWSGSTWKNAATPSGAVEVEGPLTQAMFDRLRTQFEERFSGAHNARKVMILDNRTTWKSLSVSPEDAEVLASRRFSVEEVSRLMGVPGPIIGDQSHSTFTNSETLIRFFAQSTLASWCNKFEAEFARSILGASNTDLEISLDLSGLLRGDPAQRWQNYAIAAQNNILSIDEIREAEGYNPRPANSPATPVVG